MRVDAKLPLFTQAVTEAAMTYRDPEDDPYGFWSEGRDLTPEEVGDLNEQIARKEVHTILADEEWAIVTAGGGQEYRVAPVNRCALCRGPITVWETAAEHPVHGDCLRYWNE